MRMTGHDIMSVAIKTYDEKPREEWIFEYPAQYALLGTQIWWVTEVSIAFAQLGEGYENAMKDYQKKQVIFTAYYVTLEFISIMRKV